MWDSTTEPQFYATNALRTCKTIQGPDPASPSLRYVLLTEGPASVLLFTLIINNVLSKVSCLRYCTLSESTISILCLNLDLAQCQPSNIPYIHLHYSPLLTAQIAVHSIQHLESLYKQQKAFSLDKDRLYRLLSVSRVQSHLTQHQRHAHIYFAYHGAGHHSFLHSTGWYDVQTR